MATRTLKLYNLSLYLDWLTDHYQTSVDTSAAATADSWSDCEVEKV